MKTLVALLVASVVLALAPAAGATDQGLLRELHELREELEDQRLDQDFREWQRVERDKREQRERRAREQERNGERLDFDSWRLGTRVECC